MPECPKTLVHFVPYKGLFAGESIPGDSRQARALAVALDVRKFEIELYWKRAAYFWAFTGAALAGHLKVLVDDSPNASVLLLTSSVGLVFAFAWYLVNRASKYWQENWETHVDLLEDRIHGPLYKTVIENTAPWWKLNGPYPFSVSKINQLLSLFIIAVFALLMLNTLFRHYRLPFFPITCLALTAIAMVLIVVSGQSSNDERNKNAFRKSRDNRNYHVIFAWTKSI